MWHLEVCYIYELLRNIIDIEYHLCMYLLLKEAMRRQINSLLRKEGMKKMESKAVSNAI